MKVFFLVSKRINCEWNKKQRKEIDRVDKFTDGGAGAGDARPSKRGTRAQPKTISHLDPLSVHG